MPRLLAQSLDVPLPCGRGSDIDHTSERVTFDTGWPSGPHTLDNFNWTLGWGPYDIYEHKPPALHDACLRRVGESVGFFCVDTQPMPKVILESGSGHTVERTRFKSIHPNTNRTHESTGSRRNPAESLRLLGQRGELPCRRAYPFDPGSLAVRTG